MPRPKRVPKPAEVLAPVPDAILNQFAPEGMLTAADVEAATRRFKKALLERAWRPAHGAIGFRPS